MYEMVGHQTHETQIILILTCVRIEISSPFEMYAITSGLLCKKFLRINWREYHKTPHGSICPYVCFNTHHRSIT